jgi:hypothetical protein
MFESTAQGFNMFHDMYKTAKRAKTQRAIFCGWWRNEFYSVPGDSNIYKVYWDGKLDSEEKIGSRTSRSSRRGSRFAPDGHGGAGRWLKASRTMH